MLPPRTIAYPETGAARTLGALSSAERKVADLAVLGHTNRSISAMLCIPVSTVEQHLTRAYRKLGIQQRAQLRQPSLQS